MKGGSTLLLILAALGAGMWLTSTNRSEPMMLDVFGLLPNSPGLSGILPTWGAQGQPRRAPQQRGGTGSGYGLPRGGEDGQPVTEQEWRTQAGPYEGTQYDSADSSYRPTGKPCYYAGNGRCQDGRSTHDLWHGRGGAQ